MEKKKRDKVSLADVARVAGVTTASVSYALRNTRGVSPATRQQILKIATDLGYVRDHKVSSWMKMVQQTKAKGLWPIAWLNTHNEDRYAWRKLKFLSPYLEGAQERSLELGHRIEELWIYEDNIKKWELADLLAERGIKGVIVTHMARHLRIDWSRVAGVALEGPLYTPSLHRVATDHFSNLHLALKMVRRAGYRRIGVCLEQDIDSHSSHSISGSISYYNTTLRPSERVTPLFYPWGAPDSAAQGQKQAIEWLAKERPEVVIGHANLLLNWAEQAGLRVPDQLGVVHLAIDDDVNDWAGVCSNRREAGAIAVELLISRIEKEQFGAPKVPSKTLIRGRWSPGWTLRRN